ncbi:MAG: uracil-DNA glycosylase family protein [Acidimicrobiales bacterium]|nr:uracil-DNA glycosylase family protein [Acidimicrobiales bacterium]
MSLDRQTAAVYEARAAAWATARVGKSVDAARRLVARLGVDHAPVLDLGCGPGYLTAALPSATIALDPAAAMLGLLRETLPNALAVQGEAGALPFATESLGGAVVNAVFVHIDRPHLPMALAELHRTLAVDAPVEIGMFGGDQDLTAMTTGDFAGRRFSLWQDDHLLDVYVGAGFAVDEHRHRETEHWPNLLSSLTRRRSLPDTVGPGMRLLVCGLNPSLHAADMGVGFGRGGNRFWPAALAAGIVTVDRDPRHALREHGIGMTDLVKRATPRADELDRREYVDGLARLERLCAWLRPEAVCMVGLSGWRAAADRKATAGWQDRTLGGSPVYVMPSTSGLNAHAQLPDLTQHLRAAAAGR